LTFREAQSRLVADLRQRIHNGDLTERGLARITGISQPHVHNVLKGARFLSVGFLDQILKTLHYSAIDLLTIPELESAIARRTRPHRLELPLLASPIGPGSAWAGIGPEKMRFSVPDDIGGIALELVLARVKFDPAQADRLTGKDMAALDTSRTRLEALDPDGLYVINRGGETPLRHIRFGAGGVYLPTTIQLDRPLDWQFVEVRAEDLFEIVKAKVVWLGKAESARGIGG